MCNYGLSLLNSDNSAMAIAYAKDAIISICNTGDRLQDDDELRYVLFNQDVFDEVLLPYVNNNRPLACEIATREGGDDTELDKIIMEIWVRAANEVGRLDIVYTLNDIDENGL